MAVTWTDFNNGDTGLATRNKINTLGNSIASETTTIDSRLDSLENPAVDVSSILASQTGVVKPVGDILSGAGTTTYDIASFDYYIGGTMYSYTGSTGNATNFVSSGDFISITIDASGVVGTYINSFASPAILKTAIEIGRIATDNGSTITSIGDSALYTNELLTNLYIRFKSFEGTAFADGAGLISEYLTGQLAVQGGYISGSNLNLKTIPTEAGLDVFPIYNINGTSGIRTEELSMVVSDTQYDDGTNLVTIPNNKFIAHTLFRSSSTSEYYLEYGQVIYNTLIEAQNGIIENNFFNLVGSEVEPLARIIVQQGLGIQGIQDARGKATSQSTASTSTLGWKDNIAPFSSAKGNGTIEPTWEDIGNGHYAMNFTVNDELFVSFHVNHDYAVGTDAYPHVHFFCKDAQAAGTTVTWEFTYSIAKGHSQGQSLTGARTTILLTYTYTGAEVAGEHIIVECSDLDTIDLIEPDVVVMAGIKLLSETASGKIYGIMSDLHYQSDRDTTPFKTPNFLTGV